ncbi:transporter substrate-binding domain-containing protein, partial [Klebsiella pneumoniae]|uniref:transporter substrate-binding domain-containing protein n=1 Tax=Klebsiella pneumoniae TaxID=573 RepID=UPI0025A283A7
KLQLVPVTSANRVPYLQTDKVDLVISSLGKNAEREKVIDFSRFAANCEKDRQAILALGQALRGSTRPLVITSGTLMGDDG